jgi:hypothetical protein
MSDGSGVVAGLIYANPLKTYGAVPFGEYSALNSLFAGVRLKRFECQFSPANTLSETKTLGFQGLAIAVFPQADPSVPSSYDSVIDNADSRMWSIQVDTSPLGYTHKWRPYPKPIFAGTDNPILTASGSGGANIGCPGGIGFYGTAFPASVQVMTVRITGWYQFRGPV